MEDVSVECKARINLQVQAMLVCGGPNLVDCAAASGCSRDCYDNAVLRNPLRRRLRDSLLCNIAIHLRDLVESDILRPDPRDSSTSVVIRLRLVWRRAGALVGDHIFQPDIDIAKDIPEELNQTLSVCLSRLCCPSLRMPIADHGKIHIVFGGLQSPQASQYSGRNTEPRSCPRR